MATVDFTEKLKEMELSKHEPLFIKVDRADVLPGLTVSVYQSKDTDEIYYATREACLMVGYSVNWMSSAMSRESTLNELIRFGLSNPLTEIRVKIGRIRKPVKALTRSDLMALIEYAREAGNKDAIVLYRTFQILGLHKAAGIASEQNQIGKIYSAIEGAQDVISE